MVIFMAIMRKPVSRARKLVTAGLASVALLGAGRAVAQERQTRGPVVEERIEKRIIAKEPEEEFCRAFALDIIKNPSTFIRLKKHPYKKLILLYVSEYFRDVKVNSSRSVATKAAEGKFGECPELLQAVLDGLFANRNSQ